MPSVFILLTVYDHDKDETEGVFSTREKAESYKKKLLKCRNHTKEIDYFIIEIVVDEAENLVIKTEYVFEINPNYKKFPRFKSDVLVKENAKGRSQYTDNNVYVGVSYVNMDHAEKLAKEAEARCKAEKKLKRRDKKFIVEIN